MQKRALWIKFPCSEEEMDAHKRIWQRKFSMPSAIGAIDCTHILIQKPQEHGDEYINRKGLASINVQATGDGNECFTSLNCEWAGSVHDARIWRNSEVQTILNENPAGAILLGDEGYPLTPFLMTPFKNAETPKELIYNKIHTKERCIIERIFG